MKIERLTRDHLKDMRLQPHQRRWEGRLTEHQWDQLDGWVAVKDGKPVAAAGIMDVGGGRGEAWCLLGPDAPMVAVTRALLRGLRMSPYRRVAARTSLTFKPAPRWVKMLGFRFEGKERGWFEDGSDAGRWAWTR